MENKIPNHLKALIVGDSHAASRIAELQRSMKNMKENAVFMDLEGGRFKPFGGPVSTTFRVNKIDMDKINDSFVKMGLSAEAAAKSLKEMTKIIPRFKQRMVLDSMSFNHLEERTLNMMNKLQLPEMKSTVTYGKQQAQQWANKPSHKLKRKL